MNFLLLHAALEALSQASFGQGTGAIFLDDLACTGDETSLFSCSHSGVGTHNCAHSEDAGVRCTREWIVCVKGSIQIMHTIPHIGHVALYCEPASLNSGY